MDSYSWICERKFFKKLCELPFVDEIWIYGSRARGTNYEKSDIDLAVVCPEATRYDWSKTVMDIIDDADTIFKIDCIRFDMLSDENSFRKSILKDRVILYKKGNKNAEY